MSADRERAARAGEEVVQATVEDVLWQSPDGRFSVVRAVREPGDAQVVLVGDVGAVARGETLRARGRFSRHAVHGVRFQVTSFTPVMPSTHEGVARYLGSGLVPGIGPALAERLVAKFGDRTLDVVTQESARLREVPGIGKRRADAIAAAVRSRRAEAESLSYLHALGLGPSLSRKVLARYGDATARVLREDPYLVAEQIAGIGFRTADRIGLAGGIGKTDPRRAAGAVLHLVARAADDGHVYATRVGLHEGARELDVPDELVDPAVDTLAGRGMVIVENDAIYAPPLFRAERAVARHLVRLARPRAAPRGVDEALAIARELGLSDEQAEAVRVSLEQGLVVLTGGPGTGKTTTVKAIVHAHERLGHRVELAAPTGRAAKRLSEATGRDARTLHRLLEWNPKLGRFGRDARAPVDAELVLVDETSMLDVQLAESLLEAVGPSATLVLVGDADQLPPVGPGQVLRELLESGVARTVCLTRIFRQAEQSAIVRGAHAIRHGELPEPTRPGERGAGDLYIVRARDPDAIAARVLETLARIPGAYGLDAKRDVQVLVPSRRGTAGTERLNVVIQAALNPTRDDAVPGALRAGDKVMQLRNDYDRDVFNGDVGEVRRIEGGSTFVDVDGREVQYGRDDLDALALAYACTVHKAQGSEVPAVIIVIHGSHHVLLSRALLYTAVTRARRLVVLVGDPRAMARAAANASSLRTRSKLVERLHAARAAQTT